MRPCLRTHGVLSNTGGSAGVQRAVQLAAAFVEGVTNLRGRVIPVKDLRARFGLETMPPTRRSRIVVTEMGEHTVGLIVDAVSEVPRVGPERVEPPSSLVTTADSA